MPKKTKKTSHPAQLGRVAMAIDLAMGRDSVSDAWMKDRRVHLELAESDRREYERAYEAAWAEYRREQDAALRFSIPGWGS